MISIAFREAAKEVLMILEHTDEDEVKKIPRKFMDFLIANSSKAYEPDFDFNKPISELELKPKTQALLGVIYEKYWANDEENKIFILKAKQREKDYKKKIRAIANVS